MGSWTELITSLPRPVVTTDHFCMLYRQSGPQKQLTSRGRLNYAGEINKYKYDHPGSIKLGVQIFQKMIFFRIFYEEINKYKYV